MKSGSKALDGHNLQAALDQLHEDVYAGNMAPFWAIDKSAAHDDDRQVMDKTKAIPFVWS
jgi:gentisate 1,2-dioxygenase